MGLNLPKDIFKYALYIDEEAWKAFINGRTPLEAETFRTQAKSNPGVRNRFNRAASDKIFFEDKAGYKAHRASNQSARGNSGHRGSSGSGRYGSRGRSSRTYEAYRRSYEKEWARQDRRWGRANKIVNGVMVAAMLTPLVMAAYNISKDKKRKKAKAEAEANAWAKKKDIPNPMENDTPKAASFNGSIVNSIYRRQSMFT